MMTNFKNVSFYFIAPDVVKMGKDIKDELDEKGVKWEESEDLLGVASELTSFTRRASRRNGSATGSTSTRRAGASITSTRL